MRVLIDASYAARGPSGTQVYVDGLLGALAGLGVQADAVAGRTGRHLDPVAAARWQARLARWAGGADVLHHPLPALAPTRTPQVVTVHDLAFDLEHVIEFDNLVLGDVHGRLHSVRAEKKAHRAPEVYPLATECPPERSGGRRALCCMA